MRVLLAFDKFKDALSAGEACDVAESALRGGSSAHVFDRCPLTDGGEGFAKILTGAGRGQLREMLVCGPRRAPVNAVYGLVPARNIPAGARAQLGLPASDALVAVIEMASASGLALLPPDQRDPWQTTSLGTGQLVRAAAEAGATAILLGVGGSATHDLGLGALGALGLRYCGADGGEVLSPLPARWREITQLAGKPVALPPVYLACDVTNPLLGARGAAAVYAPQKGLKPADHPRLEMETGRMARLLAQHCNQETSLQDTPGAGAAGGIAFGFMTAVRARLLPGFALVSAWLDLEEKLMTADVVITGEGRFDESSLEGKGPGAVAARALALGKPVHVFAGQVAAKPRKGLSFHAITPDGLALETALRETRLRLAVAVGATTLATSS